MGRGHGDVTVTLSATTNCNSEGAICTAPNTPLNHKTHLGAVGNTRFEPYWSNRGLTPRTLIP